MVQRLQWMREFVAFLCSRECAGRLPGSPGGIAARRRIVSEFESIGLTPAGDSGGWLHEIAGVGANVLGAIEGAGVLADRTVLIAAHYDHLGPCGDDNAYWGADDNAAAVAILCEVARELRDRRPDPGRRLLFAAFDAEEPPHFYQRTMGSIHFVERPPTPIENIDMMVCMDLCGHAIGPVHMPDAVRKTLFVLGAELSEGTGALVDRVAKGAEGVFPHRLHADVIPDLSDYYAFREAGVPILFLTSGRWEHYHMTSDTPEKLDYDKMAATVDFLASLTRALSERSTGGRFLEKGADDLATLRSLQHLGRVLAEVAPQVAPMLEFLDALAAKAEAHGLSENDRHLLAQFALQFESSLI